MTSGKQEGFRVAKRTALIDFAENSPWYGVEARVTISVPFETLFWFQRNAENTDTDTSSEALKRFGDNYLVEWNLLDDDGKPYPPTGAGLASVDDSGLVGAIMLGWVEAVANPQANLSERYNGSLSSGEELTDELAKASTSLGN